MKKWVLVGLLAFAAGAQAQVPSQVQTLAPATKKDLVAKVLLLQQPAIEQAAQALAEQPACAKVEVRDQRTRDNLMTFTLVITFKPEALKPATES